MVFQNDSFKQILLHIRLCMSPVYLHSSLCLFFVLLNHLQLSFVCAVLYSFEIFTLLLVDCECFTSQFNSLSHPSGKRTAELVIQLNMWDAYRQELGDILWFALRLASPDREAGSKLISLQESRFRIICFGFDINCLYLNLNLLNNFCYVRIRNFVHAILYYNLRLKIFSYLFNAV